LGGGLNKLGGLDFGEGRDNERMEVKVNAAREEVSVVGILLMS
jgi:hypothetical protein